MRCPLRHASRGFRSVLLALIIFESQSVKHILDPFGLSFIECCCHSQLLMEAILKFERVASRPCESSRGLVCLFSVFKEIMCLVSLTTRKIIFFGRIGSHASKMSTREGKLACLFTARLCHRRTWSAA
ncbi:unnamed protein product [Scytosiphon promiscuus]